MTSEKTGKNKSAPRKILHRIVLFDILSTPSIEHQRGELMPAHLSIPLVPGFETVWAPNGYGKTFAMEVLEKIWKPSDYSQDEAGIEGGVHWLSDFLRECQAMVLSISDIPDSEKLTNSRFFEKLGKTWIPSSAERTRPFSLLMARIVEVSGDDVEEVYDLFIKPKWAELLSHSIDVEISLVKRFHGAEKAQSHFSEYEEIEPWIFEIENSDEEVVQFLKDSERFEEMFENWPIDNVDENFFMPAIPSTYSWDRSKLHPVALYDDLKDMHYDLRDPTSHSSFDLLSKNNPPFSTNWHINNDVGILDQKFDSDTSSNLTSAQRRPPHPCIYYRGNASDLYHLQDDLSNLLRVLRSTKIEYLEVPKESLRFFEDIESSDSKIRSMLSRLPQRYVDRIEEKINHVLNFNGEDDPWSRRVNLSERKGAKKPNRRLSLEAPVNRSIDITQFISNLTPEEITDGLNSLDEIPELATRLLQCSDGSFALPSHIRSELEISFPVPVNYEMIPYTLSYLESEIELTELISIILNALHTRKMNDYSSTIAKINKMQNQRRDDDEFFREMNKLASKIKEDSDAMEELIFFETTNQGTTLFLRGMLDTLETIFPDIMPAFEPDYLIPLIDYSQYTVKQLKKELEGRGKPTDGKKADLVERMIEFREEEKEKFPPYFNDGFLVTDDFLNPAFIGFLRHELSQMHDQIMDIRGDLSLSNNLQLNLTDKEQIEILLRYDWDQYAPLLKDFHLEEGEFPLLKLRTVERSFPENITVKGMIQNSVEIKDTPTRNLETPPHVWNAFLMRYLQMADRPIPQHIAKFTVWHSRHNIPIRKNILSFGQKSTIVTELFLGSFEAMSTKTREKTRQRGFDRVCLIIDEPEVGRSEHSLELLIERLRESREFMEEYTSISKYPGNSVVVLSHRNKLLKLNSNEPYSQPARYHLMQPFDIGFTEEEE